MSLSHMVRGGLAGLDSLSAARCRYRAGTCSCKSAGFCIALQALQLGTHVGCALVAQIAIFLESPVDDVFQLGRNLTIETNRRGWGRVEDGFKDDSRTFSLKGQCARRHLVQHRT